MSEHHPARPDLSTANLLVIVVGAHLRAETADRPLAYRLRERINAWVEKHAATLDSKPYPIVCCDIWYMNQDDLMKRPTISIGGAGVNALTAYFVEKLPAAVARENQVFVQLDTEYVDLRVCIWGSNHELTVDALEHFDREYLDGYLRAVITQVEPQEE